MSKTKGAQMDDVNEHYIDHEDYEVRLRILEHLAAQINNKMNAGLTLIAGSLVIPVVLKWLGWVERET
jgi:transcription elongation factor GreA-like protein